MLFLELGVTAPVKLQPSEDVEAPVDMRPGAEIFKPSVAVILEMERWLNACGQQGLMETRSHFLYCFAFRRPLTASVLRENISSSAGKAPLMFDI